MHFYTPHSQMGNCYLGLLPGIGPQMCGALLSALYVVASPTSPSVGSMYRPAQRDVCLQHYNSCYSNYSQFGLNFNNAF